VLNRSATLILDALICLALAACHERTPLTGAQRCPARIANPAADAASGSQWRHPSKSAIRPAVFPVHVESGKHYLVDAAGNPFFINGDSPWDIISTLTRPEVDQYLANRQAKGVNTIIVELIEHHYSPKPPLDAYGDAPFTTAGDFSTPNPAYFAEADYVISEAAAKGMLVLLTPAYVGYNGGPQGWYQEMVANGTAKLFAYGQYLGNRYKNFDNILWVEGGDYRVADKSLVQAIANGIRSIDSKPQTYHAQRGTAAMQFWGTAEPWLTVNAIYTDETSVVASALAEYNRSSAPFFLIEARYEGSNNATEQTVRQQAYQAILSGSTGHMLGNPVIWPFSPGWQQALDSPGSRSLPYISALFATRSWWNLQPDQANAMLTAGISSGQDRAAAALAIDHSFAIAYVPSVRSITIDMSKLAGPNVKAQWIDPSNGTFSTVSGSPFPAFGARSLQPAASNASGCSDWLLLLEATP
jgi:Protein of unknown function (DUF4038)/Putative collagen-binding domain of a collagenase